VERWPDLVAVVHRRLNMSLTNCPERTFANDNLVGGAVAGAALTTAVGRDGGTCLAATSFTCLLIAFGFCFSTLTTAGRGAGGATDGTGSGGAGIISANGAGGGTIVGRRVSMTTRSGGCCNEAMRMTGLLVSSAVASINNGGSNQFAASNNTSSDVPTQAMYRPIGMTVSADQPGGRANALIPDNP